MISWDFESWGTGRRKGGLPADPIPHKAGVQRAGEISEGIDSACRNRLKAEGEKRMWKKNKCCNDLF